MVNSFRRSYINVLNKFYVYGYFIMKSQSKSLTKL